MESAFKNMQSYPNQKDQIYSGSPHYYPGMEAAVPPQMHVNTGRPPMGYGYWPWGGNYGYASPFASHGCCNHTYLPAHCAWGSPYSHVPPHHCPVNYPSFPVQHMPPPPFYATEQPRYEYEKNVPSEHHCCGCPNHPLHQKEQNNVRIEEEEPEWQWRKNDSLVPFQSKNSPYDSLVPFQPKNSPYPIVWLPPDYSSNNEQGRGKNTGDRKDDSCDVKAHENGKIAGPQPTFWNGWVPFDLNNLVLPKHRGDGGENHQQDDGKRNFPFPLVWIPYKPEEKEREKHKVKEDISTKPSLESEKGSDSEKHSYVNRENIGDQVASKARDIPVKEVKQQNVEKEIPITREKNKDACAKDRTDNGEKKHDSEEKASSKRKSPSPLKSSKLPPVCLRVDPLPRRKNGNGSSRSPSPPSNKEKLDSQSNDASKVLKSSENKEQAKILQNETKEDKGAKTIEVVDGRTSQAKMVDVRMETPVKLPAKSENDVSTNQAKDKTKVEHAAQKDTENDVVKGQSDDTGSGRGKNEGSSRAQEMKADEVKKPSKTKLSEEEAAVVIQSVYRGYDVRRWEPIKKLKQIAKVQEQIAVVKHVIQAMKSSSDVQSRSNQRNIVAETIMSLLLKLDTIQGLHPSIREVRKSAVRELVSLQEQLDSLINEEPENPPGEESMLRCDQDALNKSVDVISTQNGNETTTTDLLDAHQNQIDGGSNYEKSGILEAGQIGEEMSEEIEKEAAESSMNKDVESAPELTIEEDEKNNEVLVNDEKFAKEDHEDLVAGQGSEPSLQDDLSAPEPTAKEDEKNNEVLENDEKFAKEDYEDLVVGQASELSSWQDNLWTPEPTIKEDKKNNEVLENDEIIAKEDHEDLVVGQRSELSSLQDNSSAKATDVAATDCDMLGNELAELRQGVLDDFCSHECQSDLMVEADASKADRAKQLEEALIESPIISEPHDTANEDSNQSVEAHEILDLQLNAGNIDPETEETCPVKMSLDNCKSDDKFGTKEEVDSKTGDGRIELRECTAQQPQNFIAHMIEPSEASDERELPNAGNYTTCNKLQENSGVTDSKSSLVSEDPLDARLEREMSSQPLQEGNLEQETGLINESANTDEATDIIRVEGAAEAKFDDNIIDSDNCITQQSNVTGINDPGEVSEEGQSQITEACQPDVEASVGAPQQGEECNTEQPLPEETLEEQVLNDASASKENAVDTTPVQVSPARDEVTKSNQKLIEENERLRDMMEKLIKSGREQLMAISSLSGRVKDLEKKLSRKRRLKVKQYRAPRSGSSCMTNFDDAADKRTIGVAM